MPVAAVAVSTSRIAAEDHAAEGSVASPYTSEMKKLFGIIRGCPSGGFVKPRASHWAVMDACACACPIMSRCFFVIGSKHWFMCENSLRSGLVRVHTKSFTAPEANAEL